MTPAKKVNNEIGVDREWKQWYCEDVKSCSAIFFEICQESFDEWQIFAYNIVRNRDNYMVGPETKNLSQRSGWRPKTHSYCRINCEKLVGGWLRSHLLIFLEA